MAIEQLFRDKTIKAKAKVVTIGEWLIHKELKADELLVFAEKQKATDKAACIEALEYVTPKKPTLADEYILSIVTKALHEHEPRLKWESARVIGNIAKLFPDQLEETLPGLLLNAANTSTVIRWAPAYAVAEILKLKTDLNKKLLPKIGLLAEKETDNGVKKKYPDALKKIKN